jgi:RNA polymerase sigma-70 factor, ECF subfamily
MSDKESSFIAYYNRYKNKIYVYFLYRVGFDKNIAEDLTSEVFLKAFKSFDGFDETRSFQSWIFAISHNHLVNYYKSYKQEVLLEEAENVFQRTEAKIEVKQELERIFKIINNMEEDVKEILLMRFVDELTNTEIAHILNKEEGAVRTQISRCLSKLREII